ncbi:hypothetical protein [Corynebacterium auriscanis]|uniref:Uncharacterized protein n=1 Tax=Corynebacterium auriscanis TaxID=99807 RepID=A0A0A2DG51_9CORY|nr:hypothetical protein [Corynebacterium auriscanis]KGM18155.1 hypothetical protein MA47_09750 [Corynebacterium auriscanis]WJY73237.1 hypothetical protein CAURIC_08120 [Corynebacterium auriscanis]
MACKLTFQCSLNHQPNQDEADKVKAVACLPDDMTRGAYDAQTQGRLVHVFFDWKLTDQDRQIIIDRVTAKFPNLTVAN